MSSIDSWSLHAHPQVAAFPYTFSIPTGLCVVISLCTISPISFPRPFLLASLPRILLVKFCTQMASPTWNLPWLPDPNESLLLFSHDDYYSYGVLGTWDDRPCAMRKVPKQDLLSLMSLRPMITDGEPWIFSPLLLLVFHALHSLSQGSLNMPRGGHSPSASWWLWPAWINTFLHEKQVTYILSNIPTNLTQLLLFSPFHS